MKEWGKIIVSLNLLMASSALIWEMEEKKEEKYKKKKALSSLLNVWNSEVLVMWKFEEILLDETCNTNWLM